MFSGFSLHSLFRRWIQIKFNSAIVYRLWKIQPGTWWIIVCILQWRINLFLNLSAKSTLVIQSVCVVPSRFELYQPMFHLSNPIRCLFPHKFFRNDNLELIWNHSNRQCQKKNRWTALKTKWHQNIQQFFKIFFYDPIHTGVCYQSFKFK